MVINIPNNWKPRQDQWPLWEYLQSGGKRAVEVAHRRWGKDDIALHYTATAAMQRVGGYWHLLPQFNQARKAIWEAVNPATGKRRIDEAFPKEIRAQTRETDMFIRFINGSTWQVVGSDSFDALVGSPPVGVVFSEYALSDPRAWGLISPILEQNDGWAIFISTSRGNNHLKTLLDFARVEPRWFGQLLTVDDTPVFNAEQIERIRREYHAQFGESDGEALFQQEYYNSFEGYNPGAYYGKQMREARKAGRICSVPREGGFEIYTFWDLGMDDSMTIWFMQAIGREFRFIDYYENTGEGLEHYAQILKSKGYIYGDHYMPHDVEVRELGTGKSRKSVAEALGIKPIKTVPRAKDKKAILAAIEAGRNILPRCWFDQVKCARGVSGLEAYHAEWDDDKKKLDNHPCHDWSSHSADSFRCFVAGFRPKIKGREDNIESVSVNGFT